MATSSEKASDHRDTMRAMRPSAPAGIFHVHGRLHITLHASEEVTVDAIQANPRHFYFSSNAAKVRRTLEQRRHSSHTHRPLMFCPQLLRIRRKDFSSASLCALWKIDPMLLSRIPTRHDHGNLDRKCPLALSPDVRALLQRLRSHHHANSRRILRACCQEDGPPSTSGAQDDFLYGPGSGERDQQCLFALRGEGLLHMQ